MNLEEKMLEAMNGGKEATIDDEYAAKVCSNVAEEFTEKFAEWTQQRYEPCAADERGKLWHTYGQSWQNENIFTTKELIQKYKDEN